MSKGFSKKNVHFCFCPVLKLKREGLRIQGRGPVVSIPTCKHGNGAMDCGSADRNETSRLSAEPQNEVAQLLARASQLMGGPPTANMNATPVPKRQAFQPTDTQWKCSHCQKPNWTTRAQCRSCGLKKNKAGKPVTNVQGSSVKQPPTSSAPVREKTPPPVPLIPAKESGPDTDAYGDSDNCYADWTRATLKEELQKLDNALSLFGETDKTDPVIAAMLTKKEALKDALNAKKSPGSRLDWALIKTGNSSQGVSQPARRFNLSTPIRPRRKQEALVQARKELEDAHVQVVAIKADVASDPDLEVKDAAAHTEVVNNLADNIVKELRDTQDSQQAQNQVRNWVRTQMATTAPGGGMGGPPEPNNDYMEGARRDCKSRDAPPPEEKAAKRRQELARQELARNVASLPPPEGAGQTAAPTQLGCGHRGCYSGSGCQHGITECAKPGTVSKGREVLPVTGCKPCIRVGPMRKLYRAKPRSWRRTLVGRDVAQQQAYFWCWWLHQLLSIVAAGMPITTKDKTGTPGPGNGRWSKSGGINADGAALTQTSKMKQEPIAVSNPSIAEYGKGSLMKNVLDSCHNGKRMIILLDREGSVQAVGLDKHMDMLVKHCVGQWGKHLNQLALATQCKIALSRPGRFWQQAGHICAHGGRKTHTYTLTLFYFECTCSYLGCKSPVDWTRSLQGGTAQGLINSPRSSGWSSPGKSFHSSEKTLVSSSLPLDNRSWSSIMPLLVASMGVEQIPGTVGPSLRQAMYGEARLANWEEPGLQQLLFRHLEKCARTQRPSVVHARPNFLDRHDDLA